MKTKESIKEAILNDISNTIDELFASENPPKDLYEMEKAISQMGNNIEKKVLEAIDEYNRKGSKKKAVRSVKGN